MATSPTVKQQVESASGVVVTMMRDGSVWLGLERGNPEQQVSSVCISVSGHDEALRAVDDIRIVLETLRKEANAARPSEDTPAVR